jgi:Integrase core domain
VGTTTKRSQRSSGRASLAPKAASPQSVSLKKPALPAIPSARNFRRLVSEEKERFKVTRRPRRPGVWSPAETLVIDWGQHGSLHVFCAISAWSRYRFVRFSDNERRETTLALLAECFEMLGGVPKVVLADRMGCLKARVVANLVVPAPDYVRFATHYKFRPDFCEAADPESKGLVENLVGYAKSDLVVGEELTVADLSLANAFAKSWCTEVNAKVHSEICAVPDVRLQKERELFAPLPSLRPSVVPLVQRKVDRLSCVRFGSARYSVPTRHIGRTVSVRVEGTKVQILDLGEIVAVHDLVAPGEVSVNDEHYGGPRPLPQRAPRPRTDAERAFVSLGEPAIAWLKAAAASGATKLPKELEELSRLEVAFGKEALIAALQRAVHFGRYRAADVKAILDAGSGVQWPTRKGEALIVPFGEVQARSLAEYAPEAFE